MDATKEDRVTSIKLSNYYDILNGYVLNLLVEEYKLFDTIVKRKVGK